MNAAITFPGGSTVVIITDAPTAAPRTKTPTNPTQRLVLSLFWPPAADDTSSGQTSSPLRKGAQTLLCLLLYRLRNMEISSFWAKTIFRKSTGLTTLIRTVAVWSENELD